MVLESTRLLWAIQRILASSSWWLRTAARARVLLKPSSFIYVLHSLSWEDQMAGARTSAAHCSSLSLSLFHSLPHLSGVSTWYQQGSHQVVRFLIGQMKTPRGSVPREQGGAFMPLFTLGLGSLSVPFVALFWWRQWRSPSNVKGWEHRFYFSVGGVSKNVQPS